MNITIFSDSADIKNLFQSSNKLQQNFLFEPSKNLKKILKNSDQDLIFYFDISKLPDAEIPGTIKFLYKLEDLHFGIVDPKGKIADIAELFHHNCFDYIGKDLIKKGFTSKRIKQVTGFLQVRRIKGDLTGDISDKEISESIATDYIYSGNSWKDIRAGKEYSFCFLLIELDEQNKLITQYGRGKLNDLINDFREVIQRMITPIKGKIWMWMDFGGLILFPFDGKKSDAIVNCFELFMDKDLISIEKFAYDTMLSFRATLHIGNTVYQPSGKTGNIISDSINSIFHLGQKFAKPGTLVLTENIHPFIPEGLRDYFIPNGEYEGRKTWRMRKIL